jgi:hypothetical protein
MKEPDQYSDAETQRRLDQALRRSLKMPPPGKSKPKRRGLTARKRPKARPIR